MLLLLLCLLLLMPGSFITSGLGAVRHHHIQQHRVWPIGVSGVCNGYGWQQTLAAVALPMTRKAVKPHAPQLAGTCWGPHCTKLLLKRAVASEMWPKGQVEGEALEQPLLKPFCAPPS